ncbi:S49 family peptidase [Deinococcus enclensis]|uniref:Signal peptide peptidase SppA n=1 Tax=Deinococcus enclensis TaxID=1049582 RepID=A0ABT9MB80_9DEIO|nr:S49 family peptidase [Deinococcus enclensis]MDP9763850.1 signal peptide peptidase SppA [Deinococcus enclensis]
MTKTTTPPSSPFLGRPLAILPSALAALEDTIRAGPANLTRLADAAPTSTREGRVAVIRVHGPILAGAPSWYREFMALTDPYELAAAIRAVAGDSTVTGIVLDVNSPGGVVEGVDLAAEAVREAAKVKPVITAVRDMMASAAFWIGCGATTILAGRTSMVGSIGTYMRWSDWSGSYDQDGIKVHVYRSGDLKAPGQMGEAHNEFVDETYSTLVEDTNAVFLRGVSLGRNVTPAQVQERWASGRVWVGEQAIAAGVADRLGTLQDAITLASAGKARGSSARAASLTPPQGGKDGHPMPPEILAMLGLDENATPEQIKAALQKREAAAKAAERTSIFAALGVTEEDGKPADLTGLKAQAEDGAAYRTALTEQIKARTITLRGNDEAGQAAAERAAKVWGRADIADLKAEADRLQAEIDTTLPGGRLSVNKTGQDTVDRPRRPASAFGVR